MLSYGLLKKVRELTTAQLADIALQMAEVHPETFLKAIPDPKIQKVGLPTAAVGMPATVTYRVPGTTDEVVLSLGLDNILKDFGKMGKRVEGIKALRTATGLQLHPAKELFDAVYGKQQAPTA